MAIRIGQRLEDLGEDVFAGCQVENDAPSAPAVGPVDDPLVMGPMGDAMVVLFRR